MVVTTLWDDITAYSFTTDFDTEKSLKLLSRIVDMCSSKGEIVADFFCGAGTTMVAAETAETGKRGWLGCDLSKTAIQITRSRLVSEGADPFLLENIGNYQRHLIYLAQARIYEMQAIVLKLYGASIRHDFPDMGTRRTNEGKSELVFVGYPDRAVTANKVAELAQMAEELDGSGFDRLVILGWDYEYNYDEILEDRKKNTRKKWVREVVSKNIPPEVYDYLRQVKSTIEFDSLDGRIRFHDKPLLRLLKPSIKREGDGHMVELGIDKYILFDYPIEDSKQMTDLLQLVKEEPLAIVDYWAVDWNYDGATFRSTWQALRKHGREIKIVPRMVKQLIEENGQRHVAVRVVDVFGNDAGSSVSIRIP
jgi:adenine-specific DNA-methyltransferase